MISQCSTFLKLNPGTSTIVQLPKPQFQLANLIATCNLKAFAALIFLVNLDGSLTSCGLEQPAGEDSATCYKYLAS